MKRPVQIAVVVVGLVAVAAFAFWMQRRAERVEAEARARTEATNAMADARTSQSSLADAFGGAAMHVATAGLVSVARAGAVITSELVPVVDAYLAKLDRALVLASAYLAFHPELDATTRASLDELTKRAKQLHAFRDQLAQLADRAAKGTLTIDELTSQLTTAGLSLLSGS
jgi:hypothetical protein